MSFVVVYDASVLFPTTLRDLLLRVAQSSLVQAKWTEEILDEMFAALLGEIAGYRGTDFSPRATWPPPWRRC
jgi:hypothetical protein